MAKGMDSDKRVINGSHGTVWLSGEEVGEAYGLKASSKFSKEQIKRAGVMTVGHKTTSIENTALYDVSFDDVTLADWEAGAVGKVESAFTFGDYKFLDKISVR